MPRWDALRPLPDHVIAPLLRALMCLPAPIDRRLVLRLAGDPFSQAAGNDYDVLFRGRPVGRIHYNPPGGEATPWCYSMSVPPNAYGREASRELAMQAFRAAWDATRAERAG